MLDQETIDNIWKTGLFIHIHNGYAFEGTDGEAMVKLAIEYEKPILVLRLPGRKNIPIPKLLDDYKDLYILDAEVEDAAQAVKQFFELKPGDELNIVSRGYGDPEERTNT